jgi:hypothetical protein
MDHHDILDKLHLAANRIASQNWARVGVMLQQWNLRIFTVDCDIRRDGGGAQDDGSHAIDLRMLREFYDEHPCCLDELVCEPLRAALSFDDWVDNPGVRLLLAELRRKFKFTNMGMERLLKSIKLAIPTSTKRRGAENLVFGGLLTQIWKDFIECHENPMVESRRTMEQAGLPVTRTRQRQKWSELRTKLSNRLAFKQWHILRQTNANATLKEAWAAVEAMSADQQAVLASSLESRTAEDNMDIDDVEIDDSSICHPCGGGMLDPSDGRWPLKSSILESCTGGNTGLAGAAHALRFRKRKSLVSCDGGLIPHLTEFAPDLHAGNQPPTI